MFGSGSLLSGTTTPLPFMCNSALRGTWPQHGGGPAKNFTWRSAIRRETPFRRGRLHLVCLD
jgi:hypothetical protein